jgi:putative ABC transport system permease protein
MLSNYFTIAFRTLSKNLLFTTLNIVGLSIGLATGLLMLLWVNDEISFDQHHPYVDQIYREVAHFKSGEEVQIWENCPAPHAAYALREIPEVERAVRVAGAGAPLVKYEAFSNIEKKGAFVDTSYFQVFKTEILAGNSIQPFGDISTLVVYESFGKKYFGATTTPAAMLGKILTINDKPFTVTAVLRDEIKNSSLQFDFLRPYEYVKAQFKGNGDWKTKDEDWGNFNDAIYYRLRPDANAATVAQKLTDIQHTHNKDDLGSFYALHPLRQVHLYGADGTDTGAQTVRIMGIAGFFILLIACINYINLATARATKRAREVGMRKAIGANRSQLIRQFLVESGLVFAIASVLSVVMTYILLPYCNDIADKKLRLDWSDPSILTLIGGTLAGTLFLSAIYPALVLSSFNPLMVMKGQLSAGKTSQSNIRKGLVVVQFACSSALLLAMFVIGRQMQFIQTRSLGYDRENVFMISLSEQTYKNREAMVRELENTAGVLDVTSTSADILSIENTTGDTEWDGKTADNNMIVAPIAVAPDFLTFFKMQLVAGHDFTGNKTDSTSFIINETAAKQIGGDPIGKRFTLWQTTGTVIGVAKDFHFASLRETIKPAIFFSRPEWHGSICVRTTSAEASKAVAAAGDLWKRFDANYPFDYAFMDASFDKMYRREQRTAQLFKGFGTIALLISCLGLFGLSAFMVEQRVKEIGVRKVLGASVVNISGLLVKDFLKLVLIAIVIASPIAYYFMNIWLTNFAYSINIQWWMFAAAGVVALAIAFLTVGGQAVKAALANPVKSLRSE